ncbi:MAG: hypothetical protein HWD58_09115 [Bacteroidota bacterium]|nr:MAG: hypothetical protein HWD58_09115 [Bacteroidota bacterium]
MTLLNQPVECGVERLSVRRNMDADSTCDDIIHKWLSAVFTMVLIRSVFQEAHVKGSIESNNIQSETPSGV